MTVFSIHNQKIPFESKCKSFMIFLTKGTDKGGKKMEIGKGWHQYC